MKKFLTVGALALAATVCSNQEASAWINCKFGVGMNWAWQSGGNNLCWGVFRNGQPGAPDWVCTHNCGYAQPTGGMPYGAAPMDFSVAPMPFQPPAPTPVAPHSGMYFGNPGYQTVNFGPDSYDYGFSYMLR